MIGNIYTTEKEIHSYDTLVLENFNYNLFFSSIIYSGKENDVKLLDTQRYFRYVFFCI